MPAALSKVSPLPFNVPIVHPETGFPTSYFQQMLQRWLTEKKTTDDLAADAVQGARQIIAGAGLTGGGDLTADRTLDVGAGTGITVGASDVAIDISAEAERIRDVIGTALVAGSNVTITVNDPGDTITIAATPAAGYTDEQAQDAVAAAIASGTQTGITVTYNDAGNALSFSVGLTLNYILNSGATGTNVGPELLAPRSGSFSTCKVVTKTSDASTDLTFLIKKNGVNIFSVNPTVSHGTSAGTVSTVGTLTSTPLSVSAFDVFTLDVTSGTSSWAATIVLE
jgi:hypothetical protein